MSESKKKDSKEFDVGKWNKENGDFARKAYETWKKENINREEKRPIVEPK